eukprot:gb/GFBE01066252.1/.p1 GENE.gb/GFBE01066252.1/~~gb/GFBE01066252.1/.p1  ORF type:complete len:693 (+),score=146.73 gb/GFBE01066252.1/:1-2079(+)
MHRRGFVKLEEPVVEDPYGGYLPTDDVAPAGSVCNEERYNEEEQDDDEEERWRVKEEPSEQDEYEWIEGNIREVRWDIFEVTTDPASGNGWAWVRRDRHQAPDENLTLWEADEEDEEGASEDEAMPLPRPPAPTMREQGDEAPPLLPAPALRERVGEARFVGADPSCSALQRRQLPRPVAQMRDGSSKPPSPLGCDPRPPPGPPPQWHRQESKEEEIVEEGGEEVWQEEFQVEVEEEVAEDGDEEMHEHVQEEAEQEEAQQEECEPDVGEQQEEQGAEDGVRLSERFRGVLLEQRFAAEFKARILHQRKLKIEEQYNVQIAMEMMAASNAPPSAPSTAEALPGNPRPRAWPVLPSKVEPEEDSPTSPPTTGPVVHQVAKQPKPPPTPPPTFALAAPQATAKPKPSSMSSLTSAPVAPQATRKPKPPPTPPPKTGPFAHQEVEKSKPKLLPVAKIASKPTRPILSAAHGVLRKSVKREVGEETFPALKQEVVEEPPPAQQEDDFIAEEDPAALQGDEEGSGVVDESFDDETSVDAAGGAQTGKRRREPSPSMDLFRLPPKHAVIRFLCHYLLRGIQPQEVEYSTESVGTSHRTTLVINCLLNGNVFTGPVCKTQNEAEAAAATMVLEHYAEEIRRLAPSIPMTIPKRQQRQPGQTMAYAAVKMEPASGSFVEASYNDSPRMSNALQKWRRRTT